MFVTASQSHCALPMCIMSSRWAHDAVCDLAQPPHKPGVLGGRQWALILIFQGNLLNLFRGFCRLPQRLGSMVKSVIQVILELAITKDRHALPQRVCDDYDISPGKHEKMYLSQPSGRNFVISTPQECQDIILSIWHRSLYGDASQMPYQGVSECVCQCSRQWWGGQGTKQLPWVWGSTEGGQKAVFIAFYLLLMWISSVQGVMDCGLGYQNTQPVRYLSVWILSWS